MIPRAGPSPLYSWRLLVLPYVDAGPLLEEFHRDEPWDSPHNRAFVARMPRIFGRRGDPSSGEGKTAIEVVSGPGTAFEGEGQPLLNSDGTSNFPDGLDTTLLLVETERSVPWTSPSEIGIGPGQTLPPLGGGFTHAPSWFAEPSSPPTHFNVVFADSGARSVPRSIGPDGIRAFASRNGGEPVTIPR